MTSTDIFTVANSEQEFRVYVITKLEANDKRLDGIDKRLDGIDKRLDGIETEQKETRALIGQIDKSQAVISTRLDDLQTSVYWGLSAIGIFIALLALVVAFVSWVRPRDDAKPESQSVPSRWELEGMIRDVVRACCRK